MLLLQHIPDIWVCSAVDFENSDASDAELLCKVNFVFDSARIISGGPMR